MEKTEWGTTLLPFLGLLIDTVKQIIAIPVDKVEQVQLLIRELLSGKKTTVLKLQHLCGFLNFLCKCIVPSWTFTRRLYGMISPVLAPHHHININREMKEDLKIWIQFLDNPVVYCRPFIDLSETLVADKLDWYTDASGVIGCGGYHRHRWFQLKWDQDFLDSMKPSIEYQELFTVAASIKLWLYMYPNSRICLFCDNKTVVQQIWNTSSSCKNCMVLIILIVRQCFLFNVRIFAEWADTDSNNLADVIS